MSIGKGGLAPSAHSTIPSPLVSETSRSADQPPISLRATRRGFIPRGYPRFVEKPVAHVNDLEAHHPHPIGKDHRVRFGQDKLHRVFQKFPLRHMVMPNC